MCEEEKLQEQKDAVASMRSAQANMSKALDRISRLERALGVCADQLVEAAKLIPGYKYNSAVSLKDTYLTAATDARKVL